MLGRSPHLCLVLAAIAATALVVAAAPAAQAANPRVNHFEFAFDFSWGDFCGTAADVDVSGSYRGTEFLDPNQPVDERVKLEGKTIYVNPLNGKTVTLHIADTMFTTIVSGTSQGLRVVESTTRGLASSLWADGGGLLIRDTGLITVRDTYNGDELVSQEILLDRGGHPILASGFWPAFCTAVTEGLGLS